MPSTFFRISHPRPLPLAQSLYCQARRRWNREVEREGSPEWSLILKFLRDQRSISLWWFTAPWAEATPGQSWESRRHSPWRACRWPAMERSIPIISSFCASSSLAGENSRKQRRHSRWTDRVRPLRSPSQPRRDGLRWGQRPRASCASPQWWFFFTN